MPTGIIITARKAWFPVHLGTRKVWHACGCARSESLGMPPLLFDINTYCIMKPADKPINLRLESFEMDGARKLLPLLEEFVRRARSRSKDEQVYLDAEIRLLSSPEGLRHAITFGWNRIGYTEHKRDAKGKLISCRAYVR